MRISREMKIYDIVKNFPETLNVFTANGFKQFEDPKKLETIGKHLKLETALRMKGINVEAFINLLEEAVGKSFEEADVTLKKQEKGDIEIAGLLPCPVRIPLLEMFSKFKSEFEEKHGKKIGYRLEAASLGAAWIEELMKNVKSEENLPDIFISAGFETFFSKKLFGKYKDKGVFVDITGEKINKDFEKLDIKDPKGHYSIISVIPSVFMINLRSLGDTPPPKTWEDLLKPEFEGRVAIPVGDFDMFNAILLNIYREFGEDGVSRFARALFRPMHPSEMVNKKIEKPAVSIIPFFFTKVNRDIVNTRYIWPEDGSIISPVFMLVKRENIEVTGEIAKFLYSREVGRVFAVNGLFPSLNPEVNNVLPDNAGFKWLGWDYIYSNDVSELVKKVESIFKESVEVKI